MFKVTVVLKRNNDAEYFYKAFEQHKTIVAIQELFQSLPEFISKDIVEGANECEVSMSFTNKDAFEKAVSENYRLFMDRHELITEYCAKVGHEYSFYETNE